jgi:hypothetical protein
MPDVPFGFSAGDDPDRDPRRDPDKKDPAAGADPFGFGGDFNPGDLGQLVTQTGWPAEVVNTVLSYRDSSNVYHFLTEAESVATLTSTGRLRLVARGVGAYPWAEQCPILLFATSAT